MNKPSNRDAPAEAGANAVEAAISLRARAAMKSARVVGAAGSDTSGRTGPAPGLLASLRHHLLAGETHYPDRPGMAELRRRVGAALPGAGFPARDADCVLITQGEGESLFVTILGLGEGEGTTIAGKSGGRHQRLLDWMQVRVTEPGTDADAAFHLIEYGAGATAPEEESTSHAAQLPQVHAIGNRLFANAEARASASSGGRNDASSGSQSPDAPPEAADALSDAIVIGSLDGLEGMHPFRLGFVAAPKAVRPRIAKWKQASSICSPAPSQRAALWALGVWP